MKVIYKYPLEGAGIRHMIMMPPDAKVVHVANQGYNVCLWVEHSVHNSVVPKEARIFLVVGTGHAEIPEQGAEYLGTVHVMGLVLHIYEDKAD